MAQRWGPSPTDRTPPQLRVERSLVASQEASPSALGLSVLRPAQGSDDTRGCSGCSVAPVLDLQP